MAAIKIDIANPDYSLLREAILQQIRAGSEHGVHGGQIHNFQNVVDLDPPRPNASLEFPRMLVDVFWELAATGIIAPGNGPAQPNFPWFRVTPYGRRVLAAPDYQPYDRTGYIRLLSQRIESVDPTVLAYLDESLETFGRANTVAAMVMLGVAAERVFNLLCDSLVQGLHSVTETQKLTNLLARFAIKPKVDWMHEKLRAVQDSKPKPAGFPENAGLMVTAIYDMIRSQRNDLGHPREMPPRMPSGDAHANLLIFPRYYETSEAVRVFLATNEV
jgi:hypothetical protein